MRLRKPSKQEALGLGIAENRFRSTYTRHDLWVSCESALDAERGRRRNFNRVTIHLLFYYWFISITGLMWICTVNHTVRLRRRYTPTRRRNSRKHSTIKKQQ